MTSKAEVLGTIKADMLDWARQIAAEFGISEQDALDLVKEIILEHLGKSNER